MYSLKDELNGKRKGVAEKRIFAKIVFFPTSNGNNIAVGTPEKNLFNGTTNFCRKNNFCLRKYRDMGMCLVKILKVHYFSDKLQIQTVSSFEFQRNWAKTKP